MTVLERLNMPECDKVRVPVKTLVDQIQASPREKKLLEKHIASMNLVGLLNEQTIRIRPYVDDNYSFQAIYVFEIQLKTDESLKEFSELVHSAFPESTLLIMNYKDNVYLSGASKRINRNDRTRTVIEDSVYMELSDEMNIQAESAMDLREYYDSLIKQLYRYKVLNATGIYPSAGGDYRTFIKRYENLTSEINQLEADYDAATMQNEKMRIDEELYQKENQLSDLKREINGGIVNE